VIRIRFHGRGGHGIKTASRIVGTAAFLAGYQVQDSPIYGAERRGASIAAFTRIGREEILERGVIARPDLIVIGDETLLDDPAAGVLDGQHTATRLFINTASQGVLSEKYELLAPITALDVTQLTLDAFGKASALSTGLASAAARLIGILSETNLLEATQEELAHGHLPAELIEQNVDLARDIFGQLSPIDETQKPGFLEQPGFPVGEPASSSDSGIHSLSYDVPHRASPSILVPGNADAKHTGSWRVERPEIDYDRCTRCGICFVRCPDGAIALDDEGYPVIDYDHCKGCMICWNECPVENAISKEKEVRAW